MPLSHPYYKDLLALSSGFLFTLAFAPFNYAYLALIALSLLFYSWQNCSVKRAVIRGYLFGLSSFGLGVTWVYISIHDFGGADVLIAGGLSITFAAFWALFPAMAGGLIVFSQGFCKQRYQFLIMPIVWILIDYWRGYLILNGFPWLLCAYSQLSTPLAGYIPILGAYGTGFLLALTASLMILAWQTKNKLVMSLIISIWLIGAGLKTITWTHSIGEPLKVTLIQGNITQDKKWKPENRLNTLLLYKRQTEAHWDSQIIVWPETAIPAFLEAVDEFFLQPLKQQALAHNTDLIVSLPAQGNSETEVYNAVITLGKESGMYRKNHLLPFGEYLPWQPVSGFVLKTIGMRLGSFTAGGDNQPLLKAGGYNFITSICYEDAFGDANIAGLNNAAYLVNVTNDGWFGDSIEPHQHLQIAQMRSLETGRFMLRSTNTGATAIIAPDGSIQSQAPLFTETALTGTITPMGGVTPYSYLGDKPIIIILLLAFIGLLINGYLALQNKNNH
ncbi:MAG: apolipoprotein N-acyltransferase [Methylococcaceae bacterium]